MKLVDQIVEFQHEIRDLRRDIHAHPELRFEEHRTADLVADRLAAWGIPVLRGLGGTGLVGTVRAGTSTRSIGLRADMDALPMQEHNQFEHRSRHTGKMHACGHDGHTAMLLAAAKYLARHRNFDGTVHLIFQPAEEGGAGAQRMIDDGLFEKAPCDAVFGMHNWPGLKLGQFALRAGPVMASANEFTITISGRGGHAAMPHNCTDPVLVATHLVQALQSIITRNKKPIDTAVISVTQIHAGEANNVIPDTALISGTVRTFTVEALDLIEDRMRALVEQLPPAFGAAGTLHFERNYPPTINHEKETAFAREVLVDLVGEAGVFEFEPTMGAEDFAYMLQVKPGCYLAAGNGEGDHRAPGHGLGPCMLHNPSYDFNDDLIPVGASFWVRLVERYLARSA
ncbi:MAG TPA: M20 aminoacylase family protein [Quisquiliibacterium sp.]|nr:M20 aminoacylase family protein [Quisquiliibacterium sp.]